MITSVRGHNVSQTDRENLILASMNHYQGKIATKIERLILNIFDRLVHSAQSVVIQLAYSMSM